jgi:aspartyl/asparaginyl beta-hydroxylase (cupin superfamily)
MKLAAGKSLRKHNDNIDPDIENKKIVRIHIPIRTNSKVVFTIYTNDEDERGETLNLEVGRFYYLDVTKPHSVSNNSSIDRYHLVVDCYVNEELKAIL